MKKIIFGLIFCFTSLTAHALSLNVKCANAKGKMVDCTVENLPDLLRISYQSRSDQGLNKALKSAQIDRVTGGEFSKQRTAEAILISPLFLLSKRKFESFGVEFTENGHKDFVSLAVSKKDAQTLRTMLETASGKQVQYGGTADSGGIVK